MSYSVYAKLPDGRTIKYGKKLNSVTEVNAAMNEMKKDLKDAGITAKVGYQNDNPPAPSRTTVGKSQPKAAPKTAAKKTSKPDPLDRNLKEEISKSKSGSARLIVNEIKPNVTIRQVVDSINKDGDTFKLITGRSLEVTKKGYSVQWSRRDEYIVDAVCVAVARALGRRQYDVKSAWNYLGEYGNEANYGKRNTSQLTKKERETVSPGELPKVGTILYASWGYDQTNIDYYKVDQTKGSTMIHIIPIGEKYVERGGPYGDKVMPDPTHIREWDVIIDKERGDPPSKGKWCRWDPKYKCVRLGHYSGAPSAYLWTGGPQHQTDPMFGH